MSEAPGTVVFLHAHPDDEAIFTGGTMSMLAARGWRVVLAVATDGQLGIAAGRSAEELGARRRAETRAAARLLGVTEVAFLGYHDSGPSAAPDDAGASDLPTPPGAFAAVEVGEAADRLAELLDATRADALVTYDADGIYGHPDHVQAHRVAVEAAGRRAVRHLYEATVDREYLHFVETHLVIEAGLPERPPGLGLAATHIGRPTVEIDLACDVRRVLDVKRRAMASHASQIPHTSSAMLLAQGDFAAVYGYEWYLRHGPPGPLEGL